MTAPYQSPHLRCCCCSPLSAHSVGWASRLAEQGAILPKGDATPQNVRLPVAAVSFLWPVIFIRGKQLSPQKLGSPLELKRWQQMFMSEVYCSMHWAESRHQNLLAWGEHLTRVVCLTLSAVLSIWHWVLTLQMRKPGSEQGCDLPKDTQMREAGPGLVCI